MTTTYTYSTPNPHGYLREVMIEAMLAEMEARGETLPDSKEVEEGDR